MDVNKSTRVDVGSRLELVTHRIEYLESEMKNLNTELSLLSEEQTLLHKLQGMYASNKTDQIDTQRAVFFSTSEPRVKPALAPMEKRTNRQVLLDLLDTGPATTEELTLASGLTQKQVSNCCQQLVIIGKAERMGNRTFRRAVVAE